MVRAARPAVGRITFVILGAAGLGMVGCSGPRGGMLGRLEYTRIQDSLRVDYNLRLPFKGTEVDSVAIQIRPGGPGGSIWYEADRRVKDSLYRTLGDSLECCVPAKGLTRRGEEAPDSGQTPRMQPCWWTEWPDSVQTHEIPPWSSSLVPPAYRVHEQVLPTGEALDSLRRRSIPCWWGWSYVDSRIDTALQRNEIIYRKGDAPRRGRIKSKGTLTRPLKSPNDPETYCVLLYLPGENHPRFSSFQEPPGGLWDGILPAGPRTLTYRFNDHGKGIGMCGGVGAVSLASGTPYGNEGEEYDGNLNVGLLYYTPSTVYEISAELYGLDTTESNISLTDFTLMGVRHYPYTAPSRGLSYYGAVEVLKYQEQVESNTFNRTRGSTEFGIGYDTDYNRFTYSYHTGHGGFHELSCLVGYEAIQLGKGGMKLSYLRGPNVRMAVIQLYMENRIDFRTMMLPRPGSFPDQLIVWGGMIAGWALIN